MGTLYISLNVFCKSKIVLKDKVYLKKKERRKRKQHNLHKPTFQVPSKLNQLALGLQTAFVLIQLSGVFHHCFLPPLNHHILQGRNQDILTFIIPVLSTARVHESCTICIYHIETHHWMLVYVSTLCNLYFPMTNISMLKSQIYVKCDWSLFLSLQSTFFSWELREEREQVSKLYFLILKPPVFFFFPSTEWSVSDFDTFLSAFSSAFTSVFCKNTSI